MNGKIKQNNAILRMSHKDYYFCQWARDQRVYAMQEKKKKKTNKNKH